ncbi:MAG: phosphoglucosamine mutase [Theionarchaea archaeon]|nr:phosphoglucosamine mutase [Theionarchaea archaeon]
MSLFGTSGVRGIVGQDITPSMLLSLGKAIGSALPLQSDVCMATDTRLSGDMLKSSLTAGILSTGVNVTHLGTAPTPLLAYITRALGFQTGIMITASHNPPQFNGVKLWNPSTIGYSPQQEKTVETIFLQKTFREAHWKQLGHIYTNATASETYFKDISNKIDVKTDLRVVIDPGNGAASHIASRLFRKLGIEVFPINDEPDGRFSSRPSEPREDTLQGTISYLQDEGADIAVCFDGDADRVVFCDRKGFLGYNEMISFLSHKVVEAVSGKVVATTVETGRLLDHAVAHHGASVVRGRVGDVAVAHLMQQHSACIGVEQVGVYIMPHMGMHPDSFYAALFLLNTIDTPEQIRDYIKTLPRLYFSKKSIPCPNELKEKVMKTIQPTAGELQPEELTMLDGIRLEFSDSWLLIRPSGTEPIIRVICESDSHSHMNQYQQEGVAMVTDALKEVES